MKITAKLAAAAFGVVAFSGAALANGPAGTVTPPGERAGLDLASPLPEGIYFVDIPMTGSWRVLGGSSQFDANVPIIVWSTPWTLAGGRIQLLAAAPEASVASHGGLYARGMYNPFVAAQIAFNLGNGFSVSLLSGAYIGVTGSNLTAGAGSVALANPFNQTTAHEQLALAYHSNGWNATANLMYGIVGANQTEIVGTGMYAGQKVANGDYFNYDLGLTKSIGKWEVGIVGAGSSVAGVQGGATLTQFALGGLVGYNFGPVITQFSVLSDVTESGYAAKETIAVGHIIIPLWNPEAPKAVAAKY